jgi:hypothetical protein
MASTRVGVIDSGEIPRCKLKIFARDYFFAIARRDAAKQRAASGPY